MKNASGNRSASTARTGAAARFQVRNWAIVSLRACKPPRNRPLACAVARLQVRRTAAGRRPGSRRWCLVRPARRAARAALRATARAVSQFRGAPTDAAARRRASPLAARCDTASAGKPPSTRPKSRRRRIDVAADRLRVGVGDGRELDAFVAHFAADPLRHLATAAGRRCRR